MSEDCLDFIARQDEQPADNPLRVPTLASSHVTSRSGVPGELALGQPEINKRCLDLDHEQGQCRCMESEQVDPAVGATLDDLDLSGGLPSRRLQATLDIVGAPPVHKVSLPEAFHDDGLPEGQGGFELECAADPVDDIERGIRTPSFDGGDVSTRYAYRVGDLLLRQSKPRSGVVNFAREGPSYGRTIAGCLAHRVIQSDGPSPGLCDRVVVGRNQPRAPTRWYS